MLKKGLHVYFTVDKNIYYKAFRYTKAKRNKHNIIGTLFIDCCELFLQGGSVDSAGVIVPSLWLPATCVADVVTITEDLVGGKYLKSLQSDEVQQVVLQLMRV